FGVCGRRTGRAGGRMALAVGRARAVVPQSKRTRGLFARTAALADAEPGALRKSGQPRVERVSGPRFSGERVFLGNTRGSGLRGVPSPVARKKCFGAELAGAATGRRASSFRPACASAATRNGTSSETAQALRRHSASVLALRKVR